MRSFVKKKDSLAYEFGRFYLILAYELGKKYCKKCFNSLKIILLYSFYSLSPQDDGENHYFCIRKTPIHERRRKENQ